jgi:hypothetical protein
MKFNLIIEEILNGLAKNKTVEDIAKKHKVGVEHIKSELDMGQKVEEKEHIKNKEKELTPEDKENAKKIAMDHLWEDPDYYTRLVEFEKKK